SGRSWFDVACGHKSTARGGALIRLERCLGFLFFLHHRNQGAQCQMSRGFARGNQDAIAHRSAARRKLLNATSRGFGAETGEDDDGALTILLVTSGNNDRARGMGVEFISSWNRERTPVKQNSVCIIEIRNCHVGLRATYEEQVLIFEA